MGDEIKLVLYDGGGHVLIFHSKIGPATADANVVVAVVVYMHK